MEAPHPGTVLSSRYELDEVVGEGGMASVWRATDRVLERPVAVKILHANLAADPTFRERFRTEATASARLNHPSIVNIFDTGEDAGCTYIVMELMEGPTLRQMLAERGSITPEVVVPVMIQVLEALQFAHENGVVHRDVKPGNILVSADGRAKVADFGIAKAAFAGSDDPTTTGRVLGSVPYLSPEQVENKPTDARSDVYSAGATMYEALTGRAPFVAETDLASAVLRLTREPTPPRAIRPGIPRPLEAIVLRSLARWPDDRYASARDMAGALARLGVTADRPSAAPTRAAEEPARGGLFRSWMLVPLLALMAAAAAITVGILAGRLEFGGPLGIRPKHSPSPSASAVGSPLHIVNVTAADPFADGHEHDQLLPDITDGNPRTFWTTEGYFQPTLGKPGVGVLFDLGSSHTVTGFKLLTPLKGWTFQIRVGNDPGALPSRSASGPQFTAALRMNQSIPPVTGRYVLLWITRVVPSPQGGDRAEVAEFKVLGS